jgi:hypothetical protein
VLLTAIPPRGVDPVALQRTFNDLAIDLSRNDANLEDAVRRGNSVGTGWEEWFKATADTLLHARDGFAAVRPDQPALVEALGKDALDLAASGGQIGAARRNGNTFGRGWDTTLDHKIADVRAAADLLVQGSPVPPVPPVQPPNGGSGVADAARAASELVQQSLGIIQRLPQSDRGSDATKQGRLDAFHLNEQAQHAIEPLFSTADAATVSQLRSADANLEDAAWQLAKKPSPDGRFNGVDLPGAASSTQAALDVLDQLARS